LEARSMAATSCPSRADSISPLSEHISAYTAPSFSPICDCTNFSLETLVRYDSKRLLVKSEFFQQYLQQQKNHLHETRRNRGVALEASNVGPQNAKRTELSWTGFARIEHVTAASVGRQAKGALASIASASVSREGGETNLEAHEANWQIMLLQTAQCSAAGPWQLAQSCRGWTASLVVELW